MIGTIVPLVQEEHPQWRQSVTAYVSSSVFGALITFIAIGSAGKVLLSWLPSDVSMMIGAIILLLLAANDLSGRIRFTPALTKGVPQAWWRHYGRTKAALMYGASLGIGVATPVPYSSFLGLISLVFFSANLGIATAVGIVYGLAHAMPVLVIGLTIRDKKELPVRLMVSQITDRISQRKEFFGHLNAGFQGVVGGILLVTLVASAF